MKKILAIAIAFVMVFAIASVAFAAIGFPKVSAPAAGVKLEVVGLKPQSGVIHIGDANNYEAYDQTKGVVAGTPVTYVATMTVSKKCASATWLHGADLYLETANINPAGSKIEMFTREADSAAATYSQVTALKSTATVAEFDTADFATAPKAFLDPIDADWGAEFGNTANAYCTSFAQTLYVLVTGSKIDKTKDATVTLYYKGASPKFSDAGKLTITNGSSDFAVQRTAPVTVGADPTGVKYAVNISGGKLNGYVVTFYGNDVDAAGNYKATHMTVSNGTNEYPVGQNNTIVDFVINATATGVDYMSISNPLLYANYKGAYDAVMGIFGWTFNGTENQFLNNAGFESKAGSAKTIKASYTYYAYTTALTVSGTAAVPDTGDMSIVGIALVAVAVIATAAVVIKKVRA